MFRSDLMDSHVWWEPVKIITKESTAVEINQDKY